jgi:hypothetical protein
MTSISSTLNSSAVFNTSTQQAACSWALSEADKQKITPKARRKEPTY